jgi:hypothetical protein
MKKNPNLGRPRGVGKHEERKWPRIKRSGSSVGAWCYVCASEHRWALPCEKSA